MEALPQAQSPKLPIGIAGPLKGIVHPKIKLLSPFTHLFFHQGSLSAGLEPEPSFKSVLCLSTPKAPAPNQEKWFVNSTKTLLV